MKESSSVPTKISSTGRRVATQTVQNWLASKKTGFFFLFEHNPCISSMAAHEASTSLPSTTFDLILKVLCTIKANVFFPDHVGHHKR